MKKKTVWLLGGIVCAVLAIVCFWFAFPKVQPAQTASMVPTSTSATTQTTQTAQTTAPYISPVDFASLQAVNPDIYAWLSVPGTNIDYPLVQNAGDDTFYLTHNSDGADSVAGAVFSEHAYNATDFSDPVTVLYGHDMASGDMFGNLQQYFSDAAFVQEHQSIVVYLPDRELHFRIFAALPYSRMHLLHYYNFEKERMYNSFIDDVFSTRSLGAVLLEQNRPPYGQQVVVLSTCLAGDNHYRFLVMGALTE